jgi:hypothetical protein
MIGLWYIFKVVAGLTPAGAITVVVSAASWLAKTAIDEFELKTLKKEIDLGILKSEELFSEKVHGTTEPIFPAVVKPTDLPPGFEAAVGHKVCGEMLWKISEWNDFWNWVGLLLHNSNSQQKIPVGRDGLWLVEAGRKRWADEEKRRSAFATGAKYKEIWEAVGMWSKAKVVTNS